MQGHNFSIGDKVNIMDQVGRTRIGIGTILSLDPSFIIHNNAIGIQYIAVRVDEALQPNASLFKANEEIRTIDDALGLSIAWLPKCLSLHV